MRRCLTMLILLMLLLPLLAAEQPPPATPTGQVPPATPPARDEDEIAAEIDTFYREYWKAWDDRDALAIANYLAKDFVHLSPAPQGVMQVAKPEAVAGIHRFFEDVRGRETVWGRRLLSVVPRSPTEAIVAVRNDFSLPGVVRETELTLEVLRKGPDARWRLVRKWSERIAY